MPRGQNPIPSLCRHKASNRAHARVAGRNVYFGRWGSASSVERYRRFVAEHLSGTDPVAEASLSSPEE